MFGRTHVELDPRYERLHLEKEAGFFSPIDLLVARFLEGKRPLTPSTLYLIAYLMKRSREGHISLSLADLPGDVGEICRQGLLDAPDGLIGKADKLVPNGETPLTRFPIYQWKESLYLEKNFTLESSVVNSLSLLYQDPIDKIVDEERLSSLLQERTLLTEEQRRAIEASLTEPITLILGGPGTGKSFTAKEMIDLLRRCSIKPSLKIAIGAPTGKAAFHLESKLSASLEESSSATSDLKIEVATLHSLLGLPGGKRERIDADLILIDEASMIDLSLMERLLASLFQGTRLILIGDPDQLPPVEAGAPFADLAGALPSVIHLKEMKRFAKGALLQFVSSLKEGDKERAWSLLNEKGPALSLLTIDVESDAFLSYVEPLFHLPASLDPKLMLDQLGKFRIISSLRQGSLGVERLNERIHAHLMKKKSRDAVPILLMKNSHQKRLYNGMTGLLLGKYAYFEERGSLREVELSNLPPYEYGYVMSIHKSQGSEFERVLMILSPGSEQFGKALLYTGATRAKKRLELVATKETLEKSLLSPSVRSSCLVERVREKIKPS